jgi:hypothetical protein
MPKYAPAREDGLKPWVVLFKQWKDSHESIVYARGRSEAEYAVISDDGHCNHYAKDAYLPRTMDGCYCA